MRWMVTFLFLAVLGCGLSRERTTYSSASPAGEIQVREKCFLSKCTVEVVVDNGHHVDRIAGKHDCVTMFAHAAWSGSRVAVFVDGGACSPIRVAYDAASGRGLDFKIAEPWLRTSIIEQYLVTPSELRANSGDVFAWATYPGDGQPRRSTEAFRQRYRH